MTPGWGGGWWWWEALWRRCGGLAVVATAGYRGKTEREGGGAGRGGEPASPLPETGGFPECGADSGTNCRAAIRG